MFLLVQNELDQMVEVMNELLEKNTLLIYEGLCSRQEGVKISDGEISQVNEVPDNIHNDPIPGSICYDDIQVQMHILQLQALRFFHLDWTNR
jgi:hypothetical protein